MKLTHSDNITYNNAYFLLTSFVRMLFVLYDFVLSLCIVEFLLPVIYFYVCKKIANTIKQIK